MKSLPKADGADVRQTAVKAGLAAIPLVGGPAAQLLDLVIAPSLARRRDIWLETLAQRLLELEAVVDELQVSRLSHNEVFVTTVVQASQVAIRTHQTEKLDALRHAVLNCAAGENPAEELVLLFLSTIDSMTALHLRVLDVLHRPSYWFDRIQTETPEHTRREGKSKLYAFATEAALPHYRGREFIYAQLVNDLRNRGFVEPSDRDPLANMRSEDTSYVRFSKGQGSGLTPLGQAFLKFIADPLPQTSRNASGQDAREARSMET